MARAVIKGRVDMDGKGAEVALTKSQQGAVRFKNKMKQVGAAIGAAFAIGIIVRFAKEITDLGSKLSDMATAAGIGTDEFQALSLAARDAGASEDQLTNSLSRLKVAQGRVIEGDVTMEKAFKSLRIPIEDVVKMSLPELFKAVADGLTKANNGAQEFNATAQILGVRNTPKLLEALNRLSEEGFEGLTTAAIEAGADIGARNANRDSPLHLACGRGAIVDALIFLVERGPKVGIIKISRKIVTPTATVVTTIG